MRMPKSKRKKGEINVGLLPLMLAFFLLSLVVCISFTILIFTFSGKNVYAKIVANDMTKKADALAEETALYLSGQLDEATFRYILRSSDTAAVVLDSQKQIVSFHDNERMTDEPPEMPDIPEGQRPDGERPEGIVPPDGEDRPGGRKEEGRFEEYVAPCTEYFEETVSASDGHFSKLLNKLGVIVGVALKNDGETLGALYMIKPIADISTTAKGLSLMLVISAAIAALLMIVPIYFLSRWLTDPLKKLTKAAGDFSAGDYSGRVSVEGSSEVNELGDTFNALADSLQENIGALTVERNRLRTVFEGLSEGIVTFDERGGYSKSNAAALELLGAGEDSDITELPLFERISNTAFVVLETNKPSVSNINIDSSIIRLSVAPIEEEDGSAGGAVALLMDVTEAERLEQTRRDYVANVSHELRTPLASIRGIADMLNDGLVKNESDKHRYYGYILKESIRLSTLINDLLELSRLQSGAVALKMRRIELWELIADVADRMTDPAQSRGMSIEIGFPEGSYLAWSNPDRLEQVLVSLMDNAVKHGEEGGAIKVGLKETTEKWEISVENPAEIENKDIEHLFERFYKADIAHSGEGTGLGLAITEEVLRLMGESISVHYENRQIRFEFTVAKY
jgi:two-component system sensor histidine kinase ResE